MVSPQESLKQKKLLDSFSENIKYIPEEYAEVVTDTTLSNGFMVHIKTYTDMTSGIVIDSVVKNDSITSKTIKRDLISEVTVYKDGKEILSKTINKSLFLDEYENHKNTLKDMTLENVWVNQFIIEDQNVVQIEIDYHRRPNVLKEYPEEYFLYYGLIVYPNGENRILHFEI